MRRVCPARERTRKPLTSRAAARFETEARIVTAPGTATVGRTLRVTPVDGVERFTETVQLPAPPPASDTERRTLRAWPRRRSPNERLVGLVKTSGWSARGSQIIPPPSRVGGASLPPRASPATGFPVRTRADLTCATVQVGCRWSSSAAAPATCGAAMLVPFLDSHEPSRAGTDESTFTPGAVTSGFRASETGVGPAEEKYAIWPDLVAAATVIAPGAEPGEVTLPNPSESKSLPAEITGTTPASAAASIAATTMSRDG